MEHYELLQIIKEQRDKMVCMQKTIDSHTESINKLTNYVFNIEKTDRTFNTSYENKSTESNNGRQYEIRYNEHWK